MKQTTIIPPKRSYAKPAMRVFGLTDCPELLVGSGGLDDYNRPPTPYEW